MKIIINSCLIFNKIEDIQAVLTPKPMALATVQDMADAYEFAKELKKFNIPYTVIGKVFDIKCDSISAYNK